MADSSEDRKTAPAEIESEVSVRTIIDTAMDGIIALNERQEIILFNGAAEDIFGWRAEQVFGKSIEVLIPARYRSRHHQDVEQFGRGIIERRRMGIQRTVMALRASGEEFPIEASISHTLVDQKQIYTVILRDVTEAARYRQQIEQQSQTLDQVSDAVNVIDVDGRIVYWNQAAKRLFGWSAEEALGRDSMELLNAGDPTELEKIRLEMTATGDWAGERHKKTRSGKVVIVEHRRTALRNASGGVRGYLCIDIDITDKKKREIAARRSQRLESIGTLAGGIAHDLNNVLTPILMGAELLKSKRESVDRQGVLNTMIASARRGSELVKQVLAFAGGIRGEQSPIDLGLVVEETKELLIHAIPKTIAIETRVDPDCPKVLGDATEVSQILMNLCINARDAMADGGTLSIEASRATVQDTPQLGPGMRPGVYAMLKVSDTGCGMSSDILERIFDPFFTTKEVGKGTGLGLATVQGIAKSYGGFVNVYSEPGRGTMFSIYLPAMAAAGPPTTVEEPVLTETGGGQTLMIVDDEEFILEVTGAVLEGAGFRVLKARNGLEAIEVFSQHRNEISLILLDMMMPGIDGLETLRRLRQIDSNVRIIACSGLRTSQRETEVKEHGANDFLPKPYTEEQLFRTISTVLDLGH